MAARKSQAPEDAQPVTAAEADELFAGLSRLPALLIAVSGGPDSVALMWLLARWRAARDEGPKLIAVTVDHGLRAEAAREARMVRRLAGALGLEHHTLRWHGDKPRRGIPAAARKARYALLAKLAREVGEVHVVTAHTRDDQAETVLMRLMRGSGVAGLAAMAPVTDRGDFILARPLLGTPKSRLLATLDAAAIGYVLDPTNFDVAFTRPRLRQLLPLLASEGCDARNLARLATRMGRAHSALEAVTRAAERAAVVVAGTTSTFDAGIYFEAPEEIQLRLLARAVTRAGADSAELSQIEELGSTLRRAAMTSPPRLRQTLAGALISLSRHGLTVAPAPPRKAAQKASS